jgi:hypothetical protein
MKEQERRRKSASADEMRQYKSGGINAADMKQAEIKKEIKKSQQDAAKFMHENLSKGSQGLDQQYLKDKAAKEEGRQKKLAADEAKHGYNGSVNENDLKLAQIKKEHRKQMAATSQMNSGYKGGVREDDLKLAQIKKELRQKEKETADYNHANLSKQSQDLDDQYLKGKAAKEEDRQKKLAADEAKHGYKGGINENDLKLAQIKKEQRKQMAATSQLNNGYSGGVNENDLKLSKIKKEEREKKRAVDELNHGYGGSGHPPPPPEPRVAAPAGAAAEEGSAET